MPRMLGCTSFHQEIVWTHTKDAPGRAPMLLWALLVLAATPAALSSAFGGNVGLQATLQVRVFPLRPASVA